MPVWAEGMRGVVIVVIDGDTVLFKPDDAGARSRSFLKIRLADIDAPEKEQAYGTLATRALSGMVLKQSIAINTVATDTYGRTIAYLQHGAVDVNAEMVRLGYAWAATRYQRKTDLLAIQEEARRARRGLWGDAQQPTPPWDWRRAQSMTVH
ncbi:MAG TPA: thermonuclease family protein [Thiobacillus sp.]